ncbi:MAG: hypothetical protein JXB17_10760 [Bacteroidales bacterium]|nr:hypothetical protein [Bacteroidales bacterium]
MKSQHSIFQNLYLQAFILLLFILTIQESYSQKKNKIKIVQANSLKYNKNIDPDLRRLIGDVILQHHFTIMYCDSAYFYQNANNFEAFGNIKIVQGDSLNLTCDSLKYDGNTDVARARKNVKLVNKDMVLYTDYLDYNTSMSNGIYYNGGIIENNETILRSKRGNYFANGKIFYFKDSVVVIDPQYKIESDTLKYNSSTKTVYFLSPTIISNEENYIYCEYGWYNSIDSISQFEQNAFVKNDKQIVYGDLLYYNQKTSVGHGRNNVEIYDFSRDIIAKGNKLDFNSKTEEFVITDSAMLVLINDQDSIFIHSDTIRSDFDSTGENRILKAYYKVKFYRDDLQGKCDSMVYIQKDSTIELHREPIIWSGENQLTSEFMKAYIVNNMFDHVFMESSAFIASKNDSVKYDQIRGKEMTGYFRNNQLYLIDVYGNGQTIYFPKEEDDYIGMNKVESSNLKLYIEDRKIKRINFITKPTANLKPLNQVGEDEMKLKGFKWLENYRPISKYDIYRWE